mmetsp:Transcript_8745/g.21148  ORF Transcript_8745/g.21148 Transcript_8745/m.21148 type:complete len:348 (+) Transcript_8745:300-1343(+)
MLQYPPSDVVCLHLAHMLHLGRVIRVGEHQVEVVRRTWYDHGSDALRHGRCHSTAPPRVILAICKEDVGGIPQGAVPAPLGRGPVPDGLHAKALPATRGKALPAPWLFPEHVTNAIAAHGHQHLRAALEVPEQGHEVGLRVGPPGPVQAWEVPAGVVEERCKTGEPRQQGRGGRLRRCDCFCHQLASDPHGECWQHPATVGDVGALVWEVPHRDVVEGALQPLGSREDVRRVVERRPRAEPERRAGHAAAALRPAELKQRPPGAPDRGAAAGGGAGPGARVEGDDPRVGAGVRRRVQPLKGEDRRRRRDSTCDEAGVLHAHPRREHAAIGAPERNHRAPLSSSPALE